MDKEYKPLVHFNYFSGRPHTIRTRDTNKNMQSDPYTQKTFKETVQEFKKPTNVFERVKNKLNANK